VSGELRLANAGVAPLVTSLAALARAVPIGEFAVIGGLAVLARLQGAHRVTYDLDTVATQHGDDPSAVEMVIGTEGVDGLLLGTKIDCIAVGDVPATDIPPDLLPEQEADRIFILAHRWALDMAEDLTLIAEEDGRLVAEVRCRIATPANLVAMKLQSAPKRRAARAHKAGGDYLDLYRLTSHPDMTRSIAEALSEAPHDLGSWCQREIRRCMIDEADRTVGIIVRSGAGESTVPSVDQMRRTGQSLCNWTT
jgi:hypothetical protein